MNQLLNFKTRFYKLLHAYENITHSDLDAAIFTDYVTALLSQQILFQEYSIFAEHCCFQSCIKLICNQSLLIFCEKQAV